MKNVAGSGGKRLDVLPERLPRWVELFTERHEDAGGGGAGAGGLGGAAGPALRPESPGSALEDLRFIRQTLQDSTSFTAVPGGGAVGMGACALLAAVIAALQPTYIGKIPQKDGWGNAMYYATENTTSTVGNQDYSIASAGKDGGAVGTNCTVGTTNSFNDDIVYVDGQFAQFPEGVQK